MPEMKLKLNLGFASANGLTWARLRLARVLYLVLQDEAEENGQLAATYELIRFWTGLSIQQIRTASALLSSLGLINVTRASHGLLIRIPEMERVYEKKLAQGPFAHRTFTPRNPWSSVCKASPTCDADSQ